MNAWRAAIGLVLIAANRAAFACELPTLVAIPANDALGERAAQVIVTTERYVTGIKAYAACLQAELAAAGDAAPASLRNQLIARNNHAIGEAESVLQLFEERVALRSSLALAQLIAGEGEECISATRLDSQSVFNDIAVLFVQRDGRTHLNVLERSCPDLDRFRQFAVRAGRVNAGNLNLGPVQTNRLCSKEFIQPFQFETSPSHSRECALGRFFELTEEQAASLTAQRSAQQPPAGAAQPDDRPAETPERPSSAP